MKSIVICLLLLVLHFSLVAQISIDNGSFSYSQDFDGLANSGSGIAWTDNVTIVGWYSNRTTYNAGTGSSNTGAMYSFGATSASDRALGSLASGSAVPIVGIRLKNNTSQTLSTISINFTGEQWRRGDGSANTLACSYQIGTTVTSVTTGSWTAASTLDFTAPVTSGMNTALDGNLPANQVSVSATITVNVPAGQEIMIRWADINDTGSDDGLGLDGFSISGVTLPIELVSFYGIGNNKSTSLFFSTATEINNSHFSIQRSPNGRDFNEIGQVRGAGTSYEPQEYTFTDDRPLPGKNYYRLKQVDFDGKFSYSPVVTATFGKAHLMLLAPLPANETLNILLEKPMKEDGHWQVFDMNGRLLLSGEMLAETKEQPIRIAELPEGAYMLRLTVGQEVMVEQFRKH